MMLRSTVGKILEDTSSESPTLTTEQRAAIKDEIMKVAEAIGLLVYDKAQVKTGRARKQPTGTTVEDRRAFGNELIEKAQSYRNEGLSIIATADRLTSEGHAVSKSWVQKWTKSA